jgi:hypothetical protein
MILETETTTNIVNNQIVRPYEQNIINDNSIIKSNDLFELRNLLFG